MTSSSQSSNLRYPSVAVIVPCHNEYQDLEECLLTLYHSSYQGFDVVVVDDGSQDGTRANLSRQFPQVNVLDGDGSLWWSRSINWGADIAFAKGADVVVLLNADNTIAPDTLKRLVEFSIEHPNAIVGSRVYSAELPAQLWFTGGNVDWLGRGLYRLSTTEWPEEDLVPRRVRWLGGMGVLIPKDIWKCLGGVDAQTFPQYSADSDFCLRAQSQGFEVWVQPKARVWNKLSPTALGHGRMGVRTAYQALTALNSYRNIRITYRFLRRHCPSRYRVQLLARIYLLFGAHIIRGWLRGACYWKPCLLD